MMCATLKPPEVPFWRILRQIAQFCAHPLKSEPLAVGSCIIPRKKQNYRLLGGVQRPFLSQSTESAILTLYSARLRLSLENPNHFSYEVA